MPAHTLRTIMAMTNSYARRRRRRSNAGSTAIPFMITVLISLIVFGAVALYFYNKLSEKTNKLTPMQATTERITNDDINTILFLLDPDEESRKTAVMLLHFDPVRKQIYCIGMPLELQVELDGRLMTIGACYDNHGIAQLKSALSQTLGETVDRYIQLNSFSFQTLVNIFGNPKCTVDIRDDGLQKSKTPVTLDIEAYETLLTSNQYLMETERCTKIGLTVSQLLNDCISPEEARDSEEADGGDRIAKNLDSYFNSVINVVTTDITAFDFDKHKHAISYMFESAMAPARCISLACDPGENGTLVISDYSMEDIRQAFVRLDLPGLENDDKDESSALPVMEPAASPSDASSAEAPADAAPAPSGVTPTDYADDEDDEDEDPGELGDDPLAVDIPADEAVPPADQ